VLDSEVDRRVGMRLRVSQLSETEMGKSQGIVGHDQKGSDLRALGQAG
jgi:hypothetical protein